MEAKIILNTIEKTTEFVNEIQQYDADFDLLSGHSTIDGKSLVGVLSMDLSIPITLRVNVKNEEQEDDICYTLIKYL